MRLADSLAQGKAVALLYRQLATLRQDVPLQENLADLEWQGAHQHLKDFGHSLGDDQIQNRISRWRPG